MLQKLEFEEFMSQLGVFLARQELRVIFDHFDQNKDGNIAYAEFVGVLRVSAYIPSLFTSSGSSLGQSDKIRLTFCSFHTR